MLELPHDLPGGSGPTSVGVEEMVKGAGHGESTGDIPPEGSRTSAGDECRCGPCTEPCLHEGAGGGAEGQHTAVHAGGEV